jgi:hypothetical protein
VLYRLRRQCVVGRPSHLTLIPCNSSEAVRLRLSYAISGAARSRPR